MMGVIIVGRCSLLVVSRVSDFKSQVSGSGRPPGVSFGQLAVSNLQFAVFVKARKNGRRTAACLLTRVICRLLSVS
jgi:hypothetical protein